MQQVTPWLIATVIIMFALPWLAVTFINSDAGMAVCFVLFFAVNPLYAVILGVNAGKDIKSLWYLVLFPALLFLAGAWTFFSFRETAFILYAVIYLLLGTAAMLISAFIIKKKSE